MSLICRITAKMFNLRPTTVKITSANRMNWVTVALHIITHLQSDDLMVKSSFCCLIERCLSEHCSFILRFVRLDIHCIFCSCHFKCDVIIELKWKDFQYTAVLLFVVLCRWQTTSKISPSWTSRPLWSPWKKNFTPKPTRWSESILRSEFTHTHTLCLLCPHSLSVCVRLF